MNSNSSTSYKQNPLAKWIIILLSISVVIVTSVLIYVLFSTEASDLTIELLAAMVAVVLVVASVGVTIHFQNASEIEREYKVKIFETKIELYQSFVEEVTKFDDSSGEGTEKIDQSEFDKLKNLARRIALLGSENLVSQLTEFLKNVAKYKDLHISGGVENDLGTFRQVLLELRSDLNVVGSEEPNKFKDNIDEIMRLKFDD